MRLTPLECTLMALIAILFAWGWFYGVQGGNLRGPLANEELYQSRDLLDELPEDFVVTAEEVGDAPRAEDDAGSDE